MRPLPVRDPLLYDGNASGFTKDFRDRAVVEIRKA
jgi:hypothetical protein